MDRLTGRRVCRNCGAVYHTSYNPPAMADVCDVCGGELYQRPDDAPETVRNRLYVYYKQTAPLIGYYYARKLLAQLDADRPIDAVKQDLLATVASLMDDYVAYETAGRHSHQDGA
jgi:adenylate kinase